MPRILDLLVSPVRFVTRPLYRALKAKLVSLIRFALEPLQAEVRTLDRKMDRILDINIAPDVLRDFRAHNERLRRIQADCDLIREMNPMFNSFLRDLMRLQIQSEEIAWLLDRGEPRVADPDPGAGSTHEREAA
jgi:hypothetical protein